MLRTVSSLAMAVLVGALCTPRETEGCWAMLVQSCIADAAPIIVSGEIVHIDVATGQTREHEHARYLDQAHIRIDAVHKNVLADVKVAVKGSIGAWMHSSNARVPGSESDGKRIEVRVSTDLSYPVGTKGVWHLFLDKDGRFIIHRHPQQLRPLGEAPVLGARQEVETVSRGNKKGGMTSDRWAREDRSELYPKRESKKGDAKEQNLD